MCQAKSFFFYGPATAKLAAVASQVFLFLGGGNCWMLPPNASNGSNPSAAVASQVFLFLLARNCRMLPPNPLRLKRLKRLKPLKPLKPFKPLERAKPALGAAKLDAVASQVVPFLVPN